MPLFFPLAAQHPRRRSGLAKNLSVIVPVTTIVVWNIVRPGLTTRRFTSSIRGTQTTVVHRTARVLIPPARSTVSVKKEKKVLVSGLFFLHSSTSFLRSSRVNVLV